jgi:hypothetical protein
MHPWEPDSKKKADASNGVPIMIREMAISAKNEMKTETLLLTDSARFKNRKLALK